MLIYQMRLTEIRLHVLHGRVGSALVPKSNKDAVGSFQLFFLIVFAASLLVLELYLLVLGLVLGFFFYGIFVKCKIFIFFKL